MGGIGVCLSPPKNTKTIRAVWAQGEGVCGVSWWHFGDNPCGAVPAGRQGCPGATRVRLRCDFLILKTSVCPASPPPGEHFYLIVIFKLFIRNCF